MSIKNNFIDYSKGFIQFSYCIAFLVLYIVGRVMSNSNLMGLIGMIPLFLLSLWVCFNKMTSLGPNENNRTKKIIWNIVIFVAIFFLSVFAFSKDAIYGKPSNFVLYTISDASIFALDFVITGNRLEESWVIATDKNYSKNRDSKFRPLFTVIDILHNFNGVIYFLLFFAILIGLERTFYFPSADYYYDYIDKYGKEPLIPFSLMASYIIFPLLPIAYFIPDLIFTTKNLKIYVANKNEERDYYESERKIKEEKEQAIVQKNLDEFKSIVKRAGFKEPVANIYSWCYKTLNSIKTGSASISNTLDMSQSERDKFDMYVDDIVESNEYKGTYKVTIRVNISKEIDFKEYSNKTYYTYNEEVLNARKRTYARAKVDEMYGGTITSYFGNKKANEIRARHEADSKFINDSQEAAMEDGWDKYCSAIGNFIFGEFKKYTLYIQSKDTDYECLPILYCEINYNTI